MSATKYFFTCLLLIASISALAAEVPAFELPYKKWRMISLPATPPSLDNTLEKILGDDIGAGGNYGQNWVVYAYNTDTNGYGEPVSLSDTLEKGQGYWIIQLIEEGKPVTLRMPSNSVGTSNPESIPLTASKDGSNQWNLAGNPFSFPLKLSELQLVTNSPSCIGDSCNLDRAEENNLLHNKVWIYNGDGYVEKDTSDQLNPWDGFWAAALAGSQSYTLALGKGGIDTNAPVTGRVTSTTGAEVAGVSVKVVFNGVPQNETTNTNSNGIFDLALSADTEYTLTFTAEGFANQVQRVKTPPSGENVNLDVVLVPRATPQTVDKNAAEVTLTGADGASVSVNTTFQDSQGNVVTANDGVKITITPVDVSSPVGVAAFPGDFAGIPEGQAQASSIISYGTVEYQITRASDDEILQLADGQTADIQIPIYITEYQDETSITAGDTIPLWSLNEDTGIWTQEGTGEVVALSDSPTGFALKANVSHFTWWNVDVPMDTASAIVTVNAPEAGTALIKARTSANIAWGPNTVDTVATVGSPSNPLPIPSNAKVCFWAEVSFNSGENATTPESCVTAALNTIENIDLQISDGALGIGINPTENISTYISVAAEQIRVQPTTIETTMDYTIVSGSLPVGVLFKSINSTTAVISGVPTEAGTFNLTVEGTDAEGNTAQVNVIYNVIDGVPCITRGELIAKIRNREDVTQVNTECITDMSHLIAGNSYFSDDLSVSSSFNQDISNWDVSNVTDMTGMFYRAVAFNQDISSWDVSNVTDMTGMFYRAIAFNQDIGSWDVANVSDMSLMFEEAFAFNQDIGSWNVGNVARMNKMFSGARTFNQDIGSWNVANVTNMGWMFSEADAFNQDIGSWNVASVVDMDGMFSYIDAFNQDIGSWNVSNVTHMRYMFMDADSFNQDISSWDVANVTDMTSMFEEALAFNQDIGSWNVANVINMDSMFLIAESFNQDIGGWNVANVHNMNEMFRFAKVFNQDIGSWNVANITNMRWMFVHAYAFNQDIGSWDVSKVANMTSMFSGASAFNQDLGSWDVGNVARMTDMFKGVTLSTTNYSNLLSGWSGQSLQNNVTFHGGNSKYSSEVAANRQAIIDDYGWRIRDGGVIVIVKDTTPPVITINGGDVRINVNTIYEDAGATALDDMDGDIVPVVTGSVDTATPGTYTITYTSTDAAGNSSTATRLVVVASADNIAPTANAGENITVQRGEIITLNGSGTDTDGTIYSYRWTGVGIDANYVYATTASFELDSSRFILGDIYLQLTVTDNEGATASDQIKITILPADNEPKEFVYNFELPLVIKTGVYENRSDFYDYLKNQITVLDQIGNPHTDDSYQFEFEGYSGPIGSDVDDWESFDPTTAGIGLVTINYLNQFGDGIYDVELNVVINQ